MKTSDIFFSKKETPNQKFLGIPTSGHNQMLQIKHATLANVAKSLVSNEINMKPDWSSTKEPIPFRKAA